MSARYPSTCSPPGAASHNISVIIPALTPLLTAPTTTRVFEIASGDGTHAAAYAKAFPDVLFHPSECDEFGQEQLYASLKGVENVAEPMVLDVMDQDEWYELEDGVGGGGQFDVVLASNCLHMMPFPEGPTAIFSHLSSPALVHQKHGRFAVYGPFRLSTGFFSDADEKFDAMIRARPNGERLGLRSIDELEVIAKGSGWELKEKIPMEKGNWILVWGAISS
ncbi:hypothetical protein RQP46_009010 [Phenoliferia psychrophenolica]